MRKPTLLFVNLLAMRLTLDPHGNDATSPDFDPTLIVQWGFHWQWESGTGLAIAGPVALLPQIVIGPSCRRVVMMVTDAMIALATAVLAVLYQLDVAQIWYVYVLICIRAVGGARGCATFGVGRA